MHFFITGFMGCGKSFWAKKMSKLTSIPCIDLDEHIEEKEGLSIVDIFSKMGLDYFRDVEHKYLMEICAYNNPHIIACGGGTTCREENRKLMQTSGKIILLEQTLEHVHQNILKERNKRPLLNDTQDENLMKALQDLFLNRKNCYAIYDKKFEVNHLDETTFATYLLDHA